MPGRPELSRRRFLGALGALPIGALIAACGGSPDVRGPILGSRNDDEAAPPAPAPTATPEPPVIVAPGEERRLLMAGTRHETPLHIFGTGVPGPIVAVLGGVHGNEPGGWLAAERVRDALRPSQGALIVVPRANVVATVQFVRTTDDMGDLNRMYPGDPNGIPMAQMAHEIVHVLREFRASVVLDLHESWGFYRDRNESRTGTAFLGQTVASSTAQGIELGRTVVEAVNQRTRAPQEEMILREWPPRGFAMNVPTPGVASSPEPGTSGPTMAFGGGRSSLGLSGHVPGLIAILVEMGQQQALERRIALHVDIVLETMKQMGI